MSCGMALFGQQTTVKTAFLEKWENSKDYLLAIAEIMPEDQYSFSPTERQMTFSEQLLHIKGNMDWLSTTYFTEKPYLRPEATETPSKEEIVVLLTEAFETVSMVLQNTPDDALEEVVTFFSGPKSKLQILNLLQDHVTHHRGQLIVYLNLNNIAPPPYIGW